MTRRISKTKRRPKRSRSKAPNAMTRVRRTTLFAVLVVAAWPFSATSAQAWLRGYVQDDELISQSDAVVIGHLVGPIQPVQLAYIGPGAPIFEYRARLLVTAVLTGNMPLGETPLIIHYGLLPESLKPPPTFKEQLNPKAVDPGDATSPVGIHDCMMLGGTARRRHPPGSSLVPATKDSEYRSGEGGHGCARHPVATGRSAV